MIDTYIDKQIGKEDGMGFILAANISTGEFLAVLAVLAIATIGGVMSARMGWFNFENEENDDDTHQMAP